MAFTLPPLGLSFAQSDKISASSGAPVTFGAVSIRGTATGGGSTPYNLDQSGNADSTAVTPVTSFGGGGASPTDAISGIVPTVLGMGMGLNGNQVQDPRRGATVDALGQVVEEGDAANPGVMGGLPIVGILGLAGAAIAAVFILNR